MTKTVKAISSVTILLLISKLLGFIREMVIAAYYGATYQTDAYNMASHVVSLSAALISAGIATTIIPMYSKKTEQQSKEQADLFANNIICITSLVFVFISIAGIIFAPALVKIFAMNFNEKTASLTISMMRMMFIFTVGANLVNLLSSVSRANQKYTAPSVIGFPITIITIILTVLLYDYIGIYALVLSLAVFTLIQVMILVFSLRGVFKLKPFINLTNGDLKDIIKLSLPIYLSVAVMDINIVIDRMLASGLSEGSISAMNYANLLRMLPDGVITVSLVTVILPVLSKYAAKLDFENVKALTARAVSLVFLTLLPIIIICLYYNTEIIKIVYERGAFTPDRTAMTANIFTFTIISLVFISGASLLNNSFYSMQNTKTPQIATIVMVVFNITLNLILVRYMQAAGLALATSVAYFIYFISLFLLFRKKIGSFGGLSLVKNVVKCTVASVSMIPIFLLCEFFRGRLPLFFFFAVSAAISLCVYALLLYILRVDLFIEGLSRARAFISNRLKAK